MKSGWCLHLKEQWVLGHVAEIWGIENFSQVLSSFQSEREGKALDSRTWGSVWSVQSIRGNLKTCPSWMANCGELRWVTIAMKHVKQFFIVFSCITVWKANPWLHLLNSLSHWKLISIGPHGWQPYLFCYLLTIFRFLFFLKLFSKIPTSHILTICLRRINQTQKSFGKQFLIVRPRGFWRWNFRATDSDWAR